LVQRSMNQQPPQVSLHTDGERRGPRPVLPVLLIAAGLIAIGVSMVFRHTLGRGEQGQTAVLQYEFAARAGYRSWLLSSYVSRGSVRPAEARRSADAQGVAQTLARLVSADPSSVKARVWYAAFLGEIGRDGEAAAQIAQARRLLTEPGAAEADSLAALQRLYERTAAFGTPDDVAAIADLNSSIDLDVFGPLVQEKVHEVLGDDARAKEIEHAEQLRALAWWTKVIVMFAASAVAVLAGLVVGIVHLVARSRSSEGWRRPAKAIPAAPLAVVVLVFIVLTLGVPVLAKFVVGLATGTEPGELSARFIVTWAVGEEIVIAAFCVWVASGVLSGSGLSLRDIGLKVGTGAKNVLRGIGGYLAALPIMIVAALIGYLLYPLRRRPIRCSISSRRRTIDGCWLGLSCWARCSRRSSRRSCFEGCCRASSGPRWASGEGSWGAQPSLPACTRSSLWDSCRFSGSAVFWRTCTR
jgi:hypothetical protein